MRMKRYFHLTTIASIAFASGLAIFTGSAMAQASIDQVMSEGEKRADSGAAEQQRVEQVADQTEELLSQYTTVIKVVDGLKVYNSLLQRQVDNQEKEKGILNESIDNVALIERQIVPLMTRMIDSLEEFIELDVPFLLEERRDRMTRLKGMMERSDVNPAEKFRKVIEAYQIETEYGTTFESYKGSVDIDGTKQEVVFLKIGRVSLVYQSVGANHTGAWDIENKTWVPLSPESYKSQTTKGIRVAKKQIPPDLLIVPVQTAKEVGR
jgi:hypothetical protein